MKSTISKILNKTVYLILICTFLTSAFFIGKFFYERELPEREIQKIEKEVIKEDKFDWQAFKDTVTIKHKFLAWIKLDNGISYPVVQVDSNFSMLHRDLKGNYSKNGTLFIDKDTKAPFEQPKTIIYGHNMNYSDVMFTSLLKYCQDTEYLEKHKHGKVYTENKEYDLEIVKAIKTTATNSEVYDVNTILPFMDENENYVMLSTCWDYNTNKRCVVFAKIVYNKEQV